MRPQKQAWCFKWGQD